MSPTVWGNAFMGMVSEVLLTLLDLLSFAVMVAFIGFIIWCVLGVVKSKLMYKRGFTAVIIVSIALFSGACNGTASPTSPTSGIDLQGGGGPLRVSPAFAIVDYSIRKEVCFTASGGVTPYDWRLVPDKLTGAGGLLITSGIFLREACFRSNGAGTFTGVTHSSDGQSKEFSGNFYIP
jgi:hypothetical protein